MAIFQVESDICHGRGFSRADSNGLLARIASFLMRPAVDGASQNFTVNATTDQATCSTHGYSNGDPIIVTSTTTLPDPLAESTEYYVIYVDADTFQFAETFGDAVDGTAINLTDTGTGTHSVYANGGGANCYLWADYSNDATQDFATTDVDTANDEITLTGHNLEHGQRIILTSTGSVPGGLSASTTYYVAVIDDNTISLATTYYNARVGTYINITSVGSGTHTLTPYEMSMIFTNTSGAAANDIDTGPDGGPPKFIRISMFVETAGEINIQFLMWHSLTAHSSYGYWWGQYLSTYDDADFAYDIRGGDECFLFSTRLGTSREVIGIDNFVGDSNLLEGTDKVGVLQSGVSTGTSVVLQLDTGEAANFTVDNYYYITDFDGTTRAQYVTVESVDTGADQITITEIYQDVAAGAVIGAYVHRWYGFGTGSKSSLLFTAFKSAIPFYSYLGNLYVMENQIYPSGITGAVSFEAARNYLSQMTPTDGGNYAVMRPGILERLHPNVSSGSTDMNRAYGITKNLYLIYTTALGLFLDGKTIGGKNYLFIGFEDDLIYGGNGSTSVLFLDTESTT